MHINTRVDDAKAKAVKRIALDRDHGGWPDIVDRALDLYIEWYGARVNAVPQPAPAQDVALQDNPGAGSNSATRREE